MHVSVVVATALPSLLCTNLVALIRREIQNVAAPMYTTCKDSLNQKRPIHISPKSKSDPLQSGPTNWVLNPTYFLDPKFAQKLHQSFRKFADRSLEEALESWQSHTQHLED